MSSFKVAASAYMSSPVLAVPSTESAIEVEARFDKHDITALGVVDDGKLVGVLSRSDLLKAASGESGATWSVSRVSL